MLGTRPTATTSRSNSIFLDSPSCSNFTEMDFLPVSTVPTWHPSLMSRPTDLVKIRNASLDTASSAAARKVGSASSTVTCEPRRLHTLPISRPITPAPMTQSLPGTSFSDSAPRLSQIRTLSTVTPSICRGKDPVAIMTCFASIVSEPLTLVISIRQESPAPVSRPCPWIEVTLFFLNKSEMPPVNCRTILSLRPSMVATSSDTSLTVIPWSLNLWSARS